MSTENLLYKLLSDEAFAKTFFEQINIKRDFKSKKIDKLKIQSDNIAEACNFFGWMAKSDLSVFQIKEATREFDMVENYLNEYNSKQNEIYTFEAALIYLLISGKLNVRKAKRQGFNVEYLNNLLSHYQIYISPQGEIVKNENSWLFLEFMLSNGFKLENCNNILELIQSVSTSISQYLTSYKQFLLSEKVNYSELKTYNIKGACGYIEEGEGIIVPKSIISDEYFREKQGKVVDKQIPRYDNPNINEFDTLIAYHDSVYHDSALNLEDLRQTITGLKFQLKNRYVGFITEKNESKSSKKQKVYSYILDELNKISSQEYMMIHDTLSSQNKEVYLIKRR